ncbi:hypothetical protein GPAL_1329 [Glaciecola pallidula DSM 14239 = ACAM 615]|uniref:Uncharacterized protein n=1 Tax=Brumicola pallidula DSM 14239 = ACAM 615 TaxID=1121922 RepID=K6ZCX3_9ALTE|nr:hypothetical protein GPAL_1329 [Glaciecola pallidula DSM 14239 = ACAM 615]
MLTNGASVTSSFINNYPTAYVFSALCGGLFAKTKTSACIRC